MRLTQEPDWRYLLDEFDTLYRHGSAGGSARIRGHRRKVREAFAKIVDADPPVRAHEPTQLPVTAHLGRALDLAGRGPLAALAAAIERVRTKLSWEHGYAKLSRTLARQYAYCELLGSNGPVEGHGLILGLVLFAPDTIYPQHSHRDIEESYISLAGAWSENDVAVYAPGSLILNRSGEEHRITVGAADPCLLAYAWIGPPERLVEPDMKFSRPARKP